MITYIIVPYSYRSKDRGYELVYLERHQEYRFDGKLHREEGPARLYDNGNKEWWQNGKRHRIVGPSCEYYNGARFWSINGTDYNECEYYKQLLKCVKCQFQADSKEGLLVHYDWEEEQGNISLITKEMKKYLYGK